MDNASRYQAWFDAVISGDTPRVMTSIDQGINIDITTRQGRTALMLAARHGYTSIIEALILAGADLDERVEQIADEPEHEGADIEEVLDAMDDDLLYDGGESFDDGLANLMGALGAAGEGHYDDVSSEYDEPDVETAVNGYELSTALHFAIAYGHTDVARRLLEADVQLDTTAWGVEPAIKLAVACGNTEMVELLLDAGAEAPPARSSRPALQTAAD